MIQQWDHGSNVREKVQWLRRKGVEQDHGGRTEFSLPIGNCVESIFQAKGARQPGCGIGRGVPVRCDKAKQM